MDEEQFKRFIIEQQNFMKKQSELLLQLAGNGNTNSDSVRAERTMDTLSKSIQDFNYDPENIGIFTDWYSRYTDVFEVDGKNLDDAAKYVCWYANLTQRHTRDTQTTYCPKFRVIFRLPIQRRLWKRFSTGKCLYSSSSSSFGSGKRLFQQKASECNRRHHEPVTAIYM